MSTATKKATSATKKAAAKKATATKGSARKAATSSRSEAAASAPQAVARSAGTAAADSHDLIRVTGARVNNLKDVDIELPKRRLTAFTGVSGSGKSSLVF